MIFFPFLSVYHQLWCSSSLQEYSRKDSGILRLDMITKHLLSLSDLLYFKPILLTCNRMLLQPQEGAGCPASPPLSFSLSLRAVCTFHSSQALLSLFKRKDRSWRGNRAAYSSINRWQLVWFVQYQCRLSVFFSRSVITGLFVTTFWYFVMRKQWEAGFYGS